MTVFVLSLWEKYRWGLTSFGQFTFMLPIFMIFTIFLLPANPEMMENLKSKDNLLINRMNRLKIEQTGKPIDPVSS